ncbi:GspMb/PilO family protein [Roseateles amylovorans]|uniref:GspMb/PilO family protein n=1 Tax=Roseateles amylovorans TaxID=2978473 RepID=A0ABY6ATF5_9BURK|nr:GspMb/PilO family protein [Roseateles amylovorans]UXH76060.1 GspMb/PilO family protein [Roseateles amylovorans]
MSRVTLQSLRSQGLRLRLEIALWRHGWLALVGPLLCAAALLGWWLVVRPDGLALAQSTRQLQAPPAPVAAPAQRVRNDALRWQALQETLRAAPAHDQLMRQWTDLAKAHQVRWRQTQFQTAFEPQTGTQRIKVVLPVTAAYPKLRAFTEALLRDSPNVSLDQMHFERRNTLLDQVETHISLSIWLPPPSEAVKTPNRVAEASGAAASSVTAAPLSPSAPVSATATATATAIAKSNTTSTTSTPSATSTTPATSASPAVSGLVRPTAPPVATSTTPAGGGRP